MAEFLAALVIFLASHSIPARPRVRTALVGFLGERLYLTLYGLGSLALLAWLILAARRAPYVPLWSPDLLQYWAPILAMPVALFLFIGGAIAPNPLSVSFRSGHFDPMRPGIVGITRHPILWGFVLWASSHLVPNGDLVSVVMFGGFTAFALMAMPMIDRRKQRQRGMAWAGLSRRTSILPFGALMKGDGDWGWPARSLISTALLTAISYAGLLLLHGPLFGPDPTVVLH